jgi:Formate hydrogenlyase subunit 4
MVDWIIIILVILGAPLLGGFLMGIDRVVTARMQGRVGPPVLQPFYDFFKLLGKERFLINQRQVFWVMGYLFWIVSSLVMLCLGCDLLIIVFVMALAAICFVMGGFSTMSPYSHIGSQRELLQMLAYEPVLILLAIGVYIQNNSFLVKDIWSRPEPLLFSMPLVFVAVLLILTIKMRKSPFDFSTAHHAHQEIIQGITIEYSGPYLALIELTHWYELVLVLGLVVLFWTQPLWMGLILAIIAFFIELVIDNICARMTWPWMLKLTWTAGILACVINLGVNLI